MDISALTTYLTLIITGLCSAIGTLIAAKIFNSFDGKKNQCENCPYKNFYTDPLVEN